MVWKRWGDHVVDQVMVKRIGNRSRCHVVPCRFSWSDLKSLEDGTVLRTNLQGFMINGVSVITSVDNSSGEDESAGLDIRAFCFHCVVMLVFIFVEIKGLRNKMIWKEFLGQFNRGQWLQCDRISLFTIVAVVLPQMQISQILSLLQSELYL